MLINADFSRRAVVAAHEYNWVASPQNGVERVMLDRVGAEQARATSIVRYAPDSSFPLHLHPAGEEILVLQGTFSADGHHFPAGWYLRNPPGSSHQPSSGEGAVIFVKLQQMAAQEQAEVRIDTREPAAWHHEGGRAFCPLFSGDAEQVGLQQLAAHASVLRPESVPGAELLVVAGDLVADDGQAYATGSWMRLPAGDGLRLLAGAHGATVYLKTGHLGHAVSSVA
ncbi:MULTISPECIES: cupin domain-containing protein [unclassified Acidovorax]|uniref:cupin domain-containing protein n=1 Tax=unclassified Acidovorax TaxID=2684926 RepID=UPI002882F793|nr:MULTISPECIES: DUF4863 family protein [unclassified Acidovorax]